MDLYPTICELISAPPPNRLQGTSMTPLVRGGAESIRDHVFGEQGYHGWPPEDELLYDLWFDPCETNNLIASDQHAAIIAELRTRLDRWLDETDDPFRTDTMPPPPAWPPTTPDRDDQPA